MASQLLLTYQVGHLTVPNLQNKHSYSQWLINCGIAEQRNNDLHVFELPRNTKGVKPNIELVDKIENLIKEHFNQ